MGQAGTAIAGLIGIKILTHVLSPAEFGKLALANTIIALIVTNFFGPFGQGLMRFWSVSKDRGVLDDFYSLSNRMAKYISLAAFLIMSIFILILSLFRNSEWTKLLLLSSIIGIITGLYSLGLASLLLHARGAELLFQTSPILYYGLSLLRY
jgi:O-antigen/teichoic acid export membrane protein